MGLPAGTRVGATEVVSAAGAGGPPSLAREFNASIGASFLVLVFLVGGVPTAFAQEAGAGGKPESAAKPTESGLPKSDRLRISIDFLAGYGLDAANGDQGFEQQARIGSVIVTLQGKLNDRFSYGFSFNPINEVSPLPACSESGFFRPNDPQFIYADLYALGKGPQIGCNPDGSRRTDMYRFIALDTVAQQGLVREAYLRATFGQFFVQVGRVVAPVGFTPDEAGSWTAKDAAMIQRINREAHFALAFGFAARVKGVSFGGLLSGIIGDGNTAKDYVFNRFFQDSSLDGNSYPGLIASGFVRPTRRSEFRVAYKVNQTGSKIERYAPSYFGSTKHNDNALVVSGRYQFSELNNVVAECGRYVWGLKESSSLMVGSDAEPVGKSGCYFTLQGGYRIRPGLTLGASVTREEIDRADSMIQYLSARGLYGVVEGKHDRTSTVRVFVDLDEHVRVGFYRSDVSNPYPWVSGIWAVDGPGAYTGRSLDRWGVVVRFSLK